MFLPFQAGFYEFDDRGYGLTIGFMSEHLLLGVGRIFVPS